MNQFIHLMNLPLNFNWIGAPRLPGDHLNGLEKIAHLAACAENPDLHAARHVQFEDEVVSSVKAQKIRDYRNAEQEDVSKAASRAHLVSLCFLIDTTGSMSSHIQGVRDQITTIMDDIRTVGCRIGGFSVVGYKDW
jgi:hypothetical protein